MLSLLSGRSGRRRLNNLSAKDIVSALDGVTVPNRPVPPGKNLAPKLAASAITPEMREISTSETRGRSGTDVRDTYISRGRPWTRDCTKQFMSAYVAIYVEKGRQCAISRSVPISPLQERDAHHRSARLDTPAIVHKYGHDVNPVRKRGKTGVVLRSNRRIVYMQMPKKSVKLMLCRFHVQYSLHWS